MIFTSKWKFEIYQKENTIEKNYNNTKPVASAMHIMFINTIEDYGFEESERPNWINVVRQPIERLISLYYVTVCKDSKKNVSINEI